MEAEHAGDRICEPISTPKTTGRWWSVLRDAAHPAGIVPGAVLVAGTERFWSVVRIEQVDDDDGQGHFVAVPPDDPAAARLLARSA